MSFTIKIPILMKNAPIFIKGSKSGFEITKSTLKKHAIYMQPF